jgi:trigger factor
VSEEKPAPSDYANDQVKVVMTRRPNCLIELGVEVAPVAAAAAELKALRNVAKQVSLPGFRKGRVPEAVIRKRHSQAIDREWNELLVSVAFQEAVKLTGVYPLNESSIRQPKLERASLEEGALIRFEFECYPQVPNVNADEIVLERPETVAVQESEVDQQLEQFRERHSQFESVEGRSVQQGDFVLLDAYMTEAGEERNLFRGERFQVSAEGLSQWIVRGILGKSQGDTFEGMSEIDSDASAEEKAQFEPKQCRIVIQAIESRTLPSDEKILEEMKKGSIEELRQEIRDYIISDRAREADDGMREKLWKQLVERYRFDLPKSLIDTELRALLRERLEQMKGQGASDQEIQNQKQQIEAEVLGEALVRLHTFFFVQAISTRHHLEITEAELQKQLSPLLFYQRMMGRKQDEKTLYDHAHYLAMRRKVEDFLLNTMSAAI